MRRFNQTPDTLDHSDPTLGLTPLPEGAADMQGRESQNLAWAGAQLTKLKESMSGRFDVIKIPYGQYYIVGVANLGNAKSDKYVLYGRRLEMNPYIVAQVRSVKGYGEL